MQRQFAIVTYFCLLFTKFTSGTDVSQWVIWLVLYVPSVFFSMNNKNKKRKLTATELEYLANHLSEIDSLSSHEDDDPFRDSEDSSDESYEPENKNDRDSDDSSEYTESEDENSDSVALADHPTEPGSSTTTNQDSSEPIVDSENSGNKNSIAEIWYNVTDNFSPRFEIPPDTPCTIHPDIKSSASPIEIFKKLFPPSLFIHIAGCTNQRIDQYNKEKRKNMIKTDVGELMIVIGCNLVMTYNRVPKLKHYWSTKQSLRNDLIASSISRNRCTFIMSKIYLNQPIKPPDCTKEYYAEELISCLKFTFQKYRSDSSRQSIDESMVKFKGRSALKQYLPMKPVKRSVKLWVRCDAKTGYTYNMNIYSGKSMDALEGTLGERVVYKLCESIKTQDVVLAFDRFFSSVSLFRNIQYAAVGTAISNRKNIPKKFSDKVNLQRGQSIIVANDSGVLAIKWRDTKDVILLTNCHSNEETTVKRKGKDGSKSDITCPAAIKFYNEIMGGVDLADQMAGVYELDRKSAKWWKKVFYRLLMVAVVNSWIIHNELHRNKQPLIDFLCTLSEELISEGKQLTHTTVRRRSRGRPTKTAKQMNNVGDHLPVQIPTRRRCARCSQNGKEKRTTTICQFCEIALCKDCFTPYHT